MTSPSDDSPVVLGITKSFRTLGDGGAVITFEIDPADVMRAMQAFGLTGTAVAIARLAKQVAGGPDTFVEEAIAAKPIAAGAAVRRTPLTEKPYSVQAALLGDSPDFRRWLAKQAGVGECATAEQAKQAIYYLCGVTSRRAFDVPGSDAARAWSELEAAYYADSHGRR